jgi:hypothetical protein
MFTPPGGALVLMLTVHVDELPPATLRGLSVMEVGQRSMPSDGLIVTGALALELP